MCVSCSLDAVILFPSVHLMESGLNKPQHKQQSFPDPFLFPNISVEPSHVRIFCTLKM